MSVVGCYTLDLYCESMVGLTSQDELFLKHLHPSLYKGRQYGPHPGQYTGRNLRECLKKAKRHGWIVRGDKVRCQGCVTDRAEKVAP